MTTRSSPKRYEDCTCPEDAKRGDRCTREIARCHSRARAFLAERRVGNTVVPCRECEGEGYFYGGANDIPVGCMKCGGYGYLPRTIEVRT